MCLTHLIRKACDMNTIECADEIAIHTKLGVHNTPASSKSVHNTPSKIVCYHTKTSVKKTLILEVLGVL